MEAVSPFVPHFATALHAYASVLRHVNPELNKLMSSQFKNLRNECEQLLNE